MFFTNVRLLQNLILTADCKGYSWVFSWGDFGDVGSRLWEGKRRTIFCLFRSGDCTSLSGGGILSYFPLKELIDLRPKEAPIEASMPQDNHSGQSSRSTLKPSAR